MQALDRLDWRSGFAFSAYGVTVGIRSNDPAALQTAAGLLPPGAEPREPLGRGAEVDHLLSLWIGPPSGTKRQRAYHLLYVGPTRVARTLDLDELWLAVENHLTLLVAYWARSDLVFVHAGAVGWNGQALVIPGRSHSGKTTLVAALLERGADYYSDEMAVLDSGGFLHPYPVALSLRERGERRRVAPPQLGCLPGLAPLPVRLVAVTRYVPGATWRPRRLSPGRTLLELLDNTVAARRDPHSYLPILSLVAQQAVGMKGARGEAALAADRLLAALDAQPRA